MANGVRGQIVRAAQHNGIVIAEVPHVGNAADQRLDNNAERSWTGWIHDLAQIVGDHENDLRDRIVKVFDIGVIQRLYLPPQLANLLFLIISRKDFAEAFQGDDFRGQLVASQSELELWAGAGDQPDANILREHRAFGR